METELIVFHKNLIHGFVGKCYNQRHAIEIERRRELRYGIYFVKECRKSV